MSPLLILSARQPHPKEQTLVCFPQVPLEWSSSSSTTPTTRSHPMLSLSIRSCHRTSHYWHIFLPGIKPGQLYGYRADGPNDPANGQRFDSQKVLIDPYGKSVSVGPKYDRAAACKPGDNAATCMKSVLADLSTFDWEGDQPLYRPFRRSVIYEMHVAGFTRHPNSGVAPANRGTYLGVIEKIPYLQELGITAVELLPVYQFDAGDASPRVSNYWGYDPISFFAPHLGLQRLQGSAWLPG